MGIYQISCHSLIGDNPKILSSPLHRYAYKFIIISNTDRVYYVGFGFASYLNRWIQPDSIIPDAYNSQSYDRYAYALNNPVRYTDPSGHNWWDAIGQFASGFVNEFALRNAGWISPNGQRDLGASAYESDASIAGRLVADVATIVLGVENLTTGAATMTGGTAVACGTTLCLGATVTVAGGAALMTVGGSQVSQGAMGLGGNLALLSSNNRGGSEERSQREIRKSISSLERNIGEHKATLQAYMEDPYAFDNQGFLRNAPNDEIRQSIINGRINHLQHEIDNWQQQLDYLNGLLNDN
jgi:RHS repeat-associated protein